MKTRNNVNLPYSFLPSLSPSRCIFTQNPTAIHTFLKQYRLIPHQTSVHCALFEASLSSLFTLPLLYSLYSTSATLPTPYTAQLFILIAAVIDSRCRVAERSIVSSPIERLHMPVRDARQPITPLHYSYAPCVCATARATKRHTTRAEV